MASTPTSPCVTADVDEFTSLVSAAFSDGSFFDHDSIAAPSTFVEPEPIPLIKTHGSSPTGSSYSPPSFMRKVTSRATALMTRASRSTSSPNDMPPSPSSIVSRAANYLSLPSIHRPSPQPTARPLTHRRDSWRPISLKSTGNSLQLSRSPSVPLLSPSSYPHRSVCSKSLSFFELDPRSSYIAPRTPPPPPSPVYPSSVSPLPQTDSTLHTPSRLLRGKFSPFSRRKPAAIVSYPIQTTFSPPSTPNTSISSPNNELFFDSFSSYSSVTPSPTTASDKSFLQPPEYEFRSIFRGEVSPSTDHFLTLDDDPFRRDSVTIVHPSEIQELRHSRRATYDSLVLCHTPPASPCDTNNSPVPHSPRYEQSFPTSSTPIRSRHRSFQPPQQLNPLYTQESPTTFRLLEGQEQEATDSSSPSSLAPPLELSGSPSPPSLPAINIPDSPLDLSVKCFPRLTPSHGPSTGSAGGNFFGASSQSPPSRLGRRRSRTPPDLAPLSAAQDTYQLSVSSPSRSSFTLIEGSTPHDTEAEEFVSHRYSTPAPSSIIVAPLSSIHTDESFTNFRHPAPHRPTHRRDISLNSLATTAATTDTFFTARSRPTSDWLRSDDASEFDRPARFDAFPHSTHPSVGLRRSEQVLINAPSWQAVKRRFCEGSMGNTIVWAMDDSSIVMVKVVNSPTSSGVKLVLQALDAQTDSNVDDAEEILLSFSVVPPMTLHTIIERAGGMRVGEGV